LKCRPRPSRDLGMSSQTPNDHVVAVFMPPQRPRSRSVTGVLGLRHEDIAAAKQEITIVPRHNVNRARSKSQRQRRIPVSASLIRLYGDYMHTEYGDLDSDYVFVNLFAEPFGHAMTYSAVYDLVTRIRRRTGLDFDPHWCRHTAATRMLRDGVPLESVSMLLGHSSIATTVSVYGHLTAADARKALEAAGWFAGNEVTW
ncbi:tyrosine-type recombinase/integrase, partial [Nonomuraea sp. NPDC049480]|uniref:tyrosine-type recombinase/integrase n=1 Tax=Nonomuraea sp. NPDC049480 TaxID=3364353 RepID=UPI0037A8BF10